MFAVGLSRFLSAQGVPSTVLGTGDAGEISHFLVKTRNGAFDSYGYQGKKRGTTLGDGDLSEVSTELGIDPYDEKRVDQLVERLASTYNSEKWDNRIITESDLSMKNLDDTEDFINQWCIDSGSAVETWGGDELRNQIYQIVQAGGDVFPIVVSAPTRMARRAADTPADLQSMMPGAHVVGGDNFAPANQAMAQLALKHAQRYLKKGYEVIGYCDNIDQAELIVAKKATDEVGSNDPHDVIIGLWKRAQAAKGPEKEKLMAQVHKLRASLGEAKLNRLVSTLLEDDTRQPIPVPLHNVGPSECTPRTPRNAGTGAFTHNPREHAVHTRPR
jgi:hypothetical protein